jgi:Ca2+-binding RTX toxin-like protein
MRRLAALAVLSLLVPGAALATPAASAPSVSTLNATEIGPFKGLLNGRVDPNGAQTDYYFEYGTSTSYGSKTASASAGSGTSAVAVSALLSGLVSGKTYHFRIVATSSLGTSRGGDRSFTTDAQPSVETGGVKDVGPTTATLTGRVNPRGRSTSVYFEYGRSTGYGSKTAVASVGASTTWISVTAPFSGLTPGTTYHYRLVATSDAGTTSGADRAFATSSRATVVTGAASSVTATSAAVVGTVNPNGRATTWWFEYGTSTRYGTRTSEQSAGSGTADVGASATLTGLAPGTTYHYRLVARSSAGTSYGQDGSFATASAPSAATGPPTGVSTRFATVTGTVNPNGRPTSWYFEYGRSTGYGSRTAPVSAGAAVGNVPVSTRLQGLAPGLRYHYRLVATSDGGTTVGADASFATAPLPVSSHGAVRCTIVGTQGADVLTGTPRRDVICGLGGNDRIRAVGGNDVVEAGPGNDIVFGGSGNDAIYGGTGNDVLLGGAGGDLLDGGSGRDALLGGTGSDRLFGGSGPDSLSARDGQRDLVDGGPGYDTATVDRLDHVKWVERRL